MSYRTRTYLAGDWDGDRDLIDQIHKWNKSNYWSLSFSDVHECIQASDDSLNCSIKKSLATRLDMSKTFVLIIGENTNSVRSGSCQYCQSYYNGRCYRGHNVDYRSYIEFECEKAVRDRNYMNIVVLYNSSSVIKERCPEVIRYYGNHLPAFSGIYCGQKKWNYDSIRWAIMK